MEKIIKVVGISLGILSILGYISYVLFIQDKVSDLTDTSNDVSVATAEVRIIAFGDSLTAGYGLPLSESYPAQLESALKDEMREVRVINAGVSGETTRGNLERASFIRSQNPDIVLLGIGGNDALRGLPIEDTIANIKKTVATLTQGEKPPIVILLKMQSPLNAGFAYKAQFDAMYEEIGREYSLTVAPFITPEVFLDSANKLPDGIHLNKTGYAKVVSLYLINPVREAVALRAR